MGRLSPGGRRIPVRMASWAMLAGLLAAGGLAEGQEAPPAGAATSAPTTAAGKDEFVPVARADLKLSVQCDGWFEPAGAVEVKVRPKAFNGELRVESVAPHGSAVKAGDAVLKLDTADIDRLIAAANNDYELAKANQAKAEADAKLGADADALAMRVQTAAEADAQAAVEWYEKVTGPHFLKQVELQVRFARNNVEDQDDELEQLRKMYKSEDLTNATADIVVKRAVRQLEIARQSLEMAEQRAEKTKATDYEQQKRAVQVALAQQKQATAVLTAAQAQSRAQREAALFTARANAETAKRKLDDLQADRGQFTAVAQGDGTVFWGRLAQGNWSGSGFNALSAGDKIGPDQVVVTVVDPGKLVAVAAVPEPLVARVKAGQPVEVKPKSLPELRLAGKVDRVAPSATIQGEPPKFEIAVALADAPDPRLRPGFRAAYSIDVEDATGVLAVPAAAVADGKVRVRTASGVAEVREVVAGRTDGERVEIVRGLAEGDHVQATFKKD